MTVKLAEAAGPLWLASADPAGFLAWLPAWLDRYQLPGPLVLITSASAGLPDRDAIVAPFRAAAVATGAAVRLIDPQIDPLRPLANAGAVLISGGDPFRLLRILHASGAASLIAARHRLGVPVAGHSAGAMVCGPTLAPVALTSPFAPVPGQRLDGLGLSRFVILPHHDRPGRAARHRDAARLHGRTVPLMPLWDDEILLADAAGWRIRQEEVTTRPARPADARALADVFREAAAAAWAPFIGAARLHAAPDDTRRWAARIAAAGARQRPRAAAVAAGEAALAGGFSMRERLLVAEDNAGVLGFVLFGRAPDDDLDPAAVGEVDLLYTHPRAWGAGIGRRLLERATFNLLAAGHREAVLWTEHRNERALGVYRRNGWIPDGAVRERDYLGAHIRELRHRLDLALLAGGSDQTA